MKREIEYDDLLNEIPNKYILTIVCGKRAREISKGSEALVKINKKDTLVKKVLKEVSEGKVSYIDEE